MTGEHPLEYTSPVPSRLLRDCVLMGTRRGGRVGVCKWPRRARVEKGGMELRVQQQHGGCGMWSPRTPRTRRACLGLLRDRTRSYEASLPGRGRRGASVVTVDPGARASTGGRSILNFDARRSVLLCCCRGRTERERVESALCCWTGLGSGHGGSLFPATRLPVTRASRPLK